jgi:hypothetical protein
MNRASLAAGNRAARALVAAVSRSRQKDVKRDNLGAAASV